jgi:hypothetical protein
MDVSNSLQILREFSEISLTVTLLKPFFLKNKPFAANTAAGEQHAPLADVGVALLQYGKGFQQAAVAQVAGKRVGSDMKIELRFCSGA